MDGVLLSSSSEKKRRLLAKLDNKIYRDAYVGSRTRQFLAQQMRSMRGDVSQAEFGRTLDKPQSVVSRLEDPSYGKWSLQTLLDVASKLDRAVIVQFVDFDTFVTFTENNSEEVASPASFSSSASKLEIDTSSSNPKIKIFNIQDNYLDPYYNFGIPAKVIRSKEHIKPVILDPFPANGHSIYDHLQGSQSFLSFMGLEKSL